MEVPKLAIQSVKQIPRHSIRRHINSLDFALLQPIHIDMNAIYLYIKSTRGHRQNAGLQLANRTFIQHASMSKLHCVRRIAM